MQETRVPSLDWEDPLEKDMATHCSTLSWRIPWTEDPGGLQSMRSQRVGHDWIPNSRGRLNWPRCSPVLRMIVCVENEIKRRLLLGREAVTNLDSVLSSRDLTLPAKICMVKAMVFSSRHAWVWELDHKEGWAPKNWCFWTVVLEKTLESHLDCKEIQPVHPKGNQSWIFIGRTDAEAKTLILSPPDEKNRVIGKDPDGGKNWRREEKGMTEDEMVGWHPRLGGREFEQTLGLGDGQGGLACCSPRGHKDSDRKEWLNNQTVYWALGRSEKFGGYCVFLLSGDPNNDLPVTIPLYRWEKRGLEERSSTQTHPLFLFIGDRRPGPRRVLNFLPYCFFFFVHVLERCRAW